MLKKITKLAILGAFAIQYCAFAGGPSMNTTWNPANLFIKATNGAITTGNFTITSQLTGNGSVNQATITPTYTTNGLSVLGINNPNFQPIGNLATDITTSVIGYTIDLTGNTSIETIAGFINYVSQFGNNFPSSNLPFRIETVNRPSQFITL